MSRRSRDLVAAVDACEYVTIRRLLRGGACPNTPILGLLPLPVAVETADIACVALLLHFGAAPDQRPGMGQSHTRCTGTGAFSAMRIRCPVRVLQARATLPHVSTRCGCIQASMLTIRPELAVRR